MALKSGALVFFGALALAACGQGPAEPDAIIHVEWTKALSLCPPTSFCTTRLVVNGNQAVLTMESRESSIVRNTATLDASEGTALARAAAQAQFDGLGPVIGCAGCLDGPVETLAVSGRGVQHNVTFGFDARVAELEPLLGQVRALAHRLTPPPPPIGPNP